MTLRRNRQTVQEQNEQLQRQNNQLRESLSILSNPIMEYLRFYGIESTEMTAQHLVDQFIPKIINQRNRCHELNNFMEIFRGIEPTGTNGDTAMINWLVITRTNFEQSQRVINILGSTIPSEELSQKENWDLIYNQARRIITKMLEIRSQLLKIIGSSGEEMVGIIQIIKDIKEHLIFVEKTYDQVIKQMITFDEEPWTETQILEGLEEKLGFIILYLEELESQYNESRSNFNEQNKMIEQNRIYLYNILEKENPLLTMTDTSNYNLDNMSQEINHMVTEMRNVINTQQIQLTQQQQQIQNLQQQIKNLEGSFWETQAREWRNLAFSLSNVTIDCTQHFIP